MLIPYLALAKTGPERSNYHFGRYMSNFQKKEYKFSHQKFDAHSIVFGLDTGLTPRHPITTGRVGTGSADSDKTEMVTLKGRSCASNPSQNPTLCG